MNDDTETSAAREGKAAKSPANAIPLVDLQAAHQEVAGEILAGFERTLAAAAFINGADVAAFEREFAGFSGVAQCVGVANGTDALELALRAGGVPPGSEVVLPANTFVATAEAVVRMGARPVLADVDPKHLLLDPDLLPGSVGPNTAAIVPVHLYGQAAPMVRLAAIAASHGAAVVEDAAQAHGARHEGRPVGSFGLAAGMSFYPGKNLGAYGDAGAVLTDSAELAERVRLLRDHGSIRRYQHLWVGVNSRLDTLQAVVLRAKLRKLETWNARRREAAGRYARLLADTEEVTLPQVAPGNTHVWHLYVIRLPRRDQVLQALHDEGIGAGIHFPVPIHLQPAFRHLGYHPGDFPVAEAAADEIMSLPLHPHITEDQQRRVAAVVRRVLASANKP